MLASEILTALRIKNLAQPGLYRDGRGLYFRVSDAGTKSWALRYMLDGRAREMGLGPWPDVSLKAARETAMRHRNAVRAGVDPIEERRSGRAAARLEAAKAMTFEQCAKAYIAAHEAGWRSTKHAGQWQATLGTYAYPVFGKLPVQTIDVGLVMKAVEPIWATKPETASRVRGRIESVLDWATAREYRSGENPARWRGHLENLLPKKTKVRAVEHHAALPYVEVAGFLNELRELEAVAARALEFAILTATRTGEVIGARWDEVDMTHGLWTIPGARMKAGKEHRVPLSDAALAILEKMQEQRTGDYVFPGAGQNRPLNNSAMNNILVLHQMKRDGLTVHGFRSTFSDWCAERTAYPAEVREMALAHAVGDKVEAAYRRGDLFEKRRKVMDDWARFCAQPVDASGNVQPIRRQT